MSFPKRYLGTVSHPEIKDGEEFQITVVQTSKEKGTWTVEDDTKKIKIKEKDGKITFTDDEATLVGEADKDGVITGEAAVMEEGGGEFILRPQEESSAGSPVNAARKLRVKKGAPGDEYRALSVWFIANKLLDDLGAKEDSKVYNVEPRIREKGADKDCPRDGKKGTAYVDVADDPYAGYATHMLSYTWGYYLKEIKDTLLRFCEDNTLDVKEVRVWMCFACVNQHRVKEAQAKGETVPFESFQKIFGERVQNIGHVLPMMSPWNAPFYITRVWCCFEIFTAVNLGEEKCKVTVLLPPKQSADFSEAFDKGAEKMVFRALKSIDVENAQASMPEDKEQILRIIKEGPGYHKVNTEVVKHLRNWFMVQALRTEIDRLSKLGQVYTTFGQYEAGVDVLEKAADMLHKMNEGNSPLAVRVLVNSAEAVFNHKFYDGDHGAADEALEKYTKAQGMLKKLGMEKSEFAAQLITKKNLCAREKTTVVTDDEEKCKLLESALKDLKKGREIFEGVDKLKTAEGMWLIFTSALVLADIAGIKKTDKSKSAAMEAYEEAIDIGKKLGVTEDEYYVKGIHAFGLFHFLTLENMDDASGFFLEAKVGYEALGMTDSVFYMMGSMQAALTLCQAEEKKDIKKAIACLKDCIEACESSGKDDIKGNAESILNQLKEAEEAEEEEEEEEG